MKKRFLTLILAWVLCAAMAGCGLIGGGSEGQETDAPTVALDGDFAVVGKKAGLLTSALKSAGISYAKGEQEKRIYVGDHDDPLPREALQKLRERENCYNDFVLLCNGTDLAVCGGSEEALTRGISYLIAQYAKDGKLILSPDLCYVDRAEVASVTIGDRSLSGLRVVAKDAGYRAEAEALATELSRLTGYPVEDALSADYALTLVAENPSDGGKGEVSTAYTVSVQGGQLALSARNRAALSYAVQHFARGLSDGVDFGEGYCSERTFEMQFIKATDTDTIKYCGMWQATDADHPNAMISYWNTAYAEIDFTGTAITVELARESTFQIKMDDSTYSSPYTVSGPITFFAEGDGSHTLRIYNDDRMQHIALGGIYAEAGTTLSRTPDRSHYIQFIGDSITNKMATVSHLIWDNHGWDFAASAYSGMALEDNYGFWAKNNGYQNGFVDGTMAHMIHESAGVTTIGMETAFFKLGVPDNKMQGAEREAYGSGYYTSAFDCKYESGNKPDVIFSFLGTNDELHRISNAERFTQAYVGFVERLIDVYGADIKIVVLQAISNGTYDPNQEHSYYSCIAEAGEELVRLFPDNVTFIDRDVIEKWNVEISSDNIHPTQNGYYTLANGIAETLERILGEN